LFGFRRVFFAFGHFPGIRQGRCLEFYGGSRQSGWIFLALAAFTPAPADLPTLGFTKCGVIL
jgi:hypothetical protein